VTTRVIAVRSTTDIATLVNRGGGPAVGSLVGWEDGTATGTWEGDDVGQISVGSGVGKSMRLLILGRAVGLGVGTTVGTAVGKTVGKTVGDNVGSLVGRAVGFIVG